MTTDQMLSGIARIAAACGIVAKADAIDASPPPLLLTLTVPKFVHGQAMDRLRTDLTEYRKKYNLPPFLVLQDGATIGTIIDSNEAATLMACYSNMPNGG